MKLRSLHKEYGWRGIYHVTIKVNPAYRMPLGRVAGRLDAVEGSLDAPFFSNCSLVSQKMLIFAAMLLKGV